MEEKQKNRNEYMRFFRKKNKEHLSLWNKKRYAKNKEKISARRKLWRKLNPEKEKATQARRYLKHRESLIEKSKLWKKNNPIKVIENRLKVKFGISLKDYEQKLNSQNGGCAICGKNKDYQRLGVDHCHKYKKIRGILCARCNLGIGYMGDSILLLEKAIEYLKKYE